LCSHSQATVFTIYNIFGGAVNKNRLPGRIKLSCLISLQIVIYLLIIEKRPKKEDFFIYNITPLFDGKWRKTGK